MIVVRWNIWEKVKGRQHWYKCVKLGGGLEVLVA